MIKEIRDQAIDDPEEMGEEEEALEVDLPAENVEEEEEEEEEEEGNTEVIFEV